MARRPPFRHVQQSGPPQPGRIRKLRMRTPAAAVPTSGRKLRFFRSRFVSPEEEKGVGETDSDSGSGGGGGGGGGDSGQQAQGSQEQQPQDESESQEQQPQEGEQEGNQLQEGEQEGNQPQQPNQNVLAVILEFVQSLSDAENQIMESVKTATASKSIPEFLSEPNPQTRIAVIQYLKSEPRIPPPLKNKFLAFVDRVSAAMGMQPQPQVSGDVRFPLVSNHIDKNKLHTAAICMTPYGCVIVHCRSKCPPSRNPYMAPEVRIGAEMGPVLQQHRAILTQKGLVEKQKEYAGQLVERARQGDQNAMGIIALVRDNTKRGMPRACQSFKLIQEYIKNKPHSTVGFGLEFNHYKPEKNRYFDAIMLANGDPISNSRIHRVVSSFGSEDEQQAFVRGVRDWQSKHELDHKMLDERMSDMQRELVRIGQIVGRARGLQAMRMPNSQIKRYDARAAWELGE